MPKVKATCINKEKGRKFSTAQLNLIQNLGVEGDFHAKGGDRQVSLLASESIDEMRKKGLKLDDGAFGENIITEGLDLVSLKIGQHLKLGETEVEITKIGKECVARCQIYYQTGDCIMPREGVFVKVLAGGIVKKGDEIIVL
ncbi:molybdenum cofactor sulfurase [candidate division WOR-1 bacterium RIFOXYA2_FULL_36_21]|uniref:Molybdenum cofactor sulfurase n=1 Tax=candidate division WOR-1 bacterium RIFOXYB2_FULL_36_35 TaxID=1802578 RepID=A0A1F4S7M6_UNCSA|nr:MAG: molybdenum cofactor sulfurase [candidate division WOR-1 bacterium RIFOXYA2_FULL_36_21]OGC16019.1 MAG: molybdenum cofactor sulfurase [candidate division WOR-1 bacterium RIFOXYA12_FULL_36_13]OGC16424.1 MAG: molybdenum cofactor sulfurase [candidate division WOR-1 bacterium RIFOXYB2_FULL_36_35]